MRLGYISLEGRGANDRVLAEAAALALARGVALAGCVQRNIDVAGIEDCDMEVQILRGGPVVRINQRLGAGSKGCRLNPAALEAAVAEVQGRMAGATALVINKFGKHEALGRGFRPLIGEALAAGQVVVLGVNRLNLEGFLDFAGDLAEALPANASAVAAFLGAEGP